MYLYLVKNFNGTNSRELLKRVLWHYSDGKDYRILETEHGKPYAVHQDDYGDGDDFEQDMQCTRHKNGERIIAPFFSVSHTGRIWGCLIGETEVGFDLEDSSIKRKRADAIVQRFFTENEKEYIDKNGMENFLPIWVRKEAYIKYLGAGLSEGLTTFSTVGTRGTLSSQLTLELTERIGQCFVQEVHISSPLIGAVCAAEPIHIQEIIWIPAKDAKDEAVFYLQSRERCTGEVRTHLKQKEYSTREIETTMDFLGEYGYLNDHRYVQLYIQYARQKGKGNVRIANELMQKGLSRELVRDCLSSEPDGLDESEMQDESSRAMEQARKLLKGRERVMDWNEQETLDSILLTEKEKAKIARKLAYLGYSASVTYGVIAQLQEDLKR